MKTSMLLCILISTGFNLFGQAIPDTFKILKAKVCGIHNSINTEGALYAINDSCILISNSLLKRDYYSGNYEVSPISVNFIKTLTVRGDKDVGKGALIGFGAGVLLGAIVGLSQGDDPKCTTSFYCGMKSRTIAEEKALVGGIISGIIGASVGAIIGSTGKRFTINGSVDNYREYQNDLIQRSIVNE